jgi:hypothetical protein
MPIAHAMYLAIERPGVAVGRELRNRAEQSTRLIGSRARCC